MTTLCVWFLQATVAARLFVGGSGGEKCCNLKRNHFVMNNGLPVAKERMMLHVTDELIMMETKLNKLPDVRQH